MGKISTITSYLEEEIASGRLTSNMRIPSQYELANRFLVNKTTANKAVELLVCKGLLKRGARGSGTYVAEKNYSLIMTVLPVNHPYMALIAHGVQLCAFSQGYLVINISPPLASIPELLFRIANMPVKGIITSSHGVIEDARLPVIHIDFDINEKVMPRFHISADHFMGTRLATLEMLECGHRNIIYIGSSFVPSRREGFLQTMKEAGIADAENRLFLHEWNQGAIGHLFNNALKKFPGLTGIVTASDDDAFSIIKIAQQKNIAIPEEISLTGYGNIEWLCNSFDLTSIEQHPVEIGTLAARRLIDIIEGRYRETSFNEIIPCQLIRRHSVKKL